jgi:3-phytase
MKNRLYFIIILVIFSCKPPQQIEQIDMKLKPVVSVFADLETEPVSSVDDAADDACIWVHPTDVMKSTIIGTNKQNGLVVYNLEGKELYSYPVGRVNNVDIRNGFLYKGQKVSVVTASNRTYNTITVHIVNPQTGELIDVAARPIKSELKEVYGLGMYKSNISNKIYVFICGKDGGVEQWELFEKKGYIDAKLVRNIVLSTQTEGIVADDFYGKLYVAEEDKALWKYEAEPNKMNERVRVISTRALNMKDDFEGVTIYDSGEGKGYVILSSQGNNSYAVFDRITNQYQGSFKIDDGTIDGTYDTDGIDVTNVSFGTKYPIGFFIAQDGANTQGKDSLNQNFKIVDWRKIADKLQLSE